MELTREVLIPANEADWLAMREQDVTSTEAAALFDIGAYTKTRYELHHIKTGELKKDFRENERTRWGNRLEAAIAAGIAEDFGLIVEPFKVYMRIQELRMGSSFDFKIVGIVENYTGFDESARDMFRKHGPGVMEVKNVDGLQFRRTWIEAGEQIEAPPHIEFQVQHQLEVADMNWALIAPLVGGNTPKPVLRERDTELGALICEKVSQFWAGIDAGVAPEPDFTQDAGTISKLYVDNDGSSLDLSDNQRVAELCAIYKAKGEEAKQAEAAKQAAKAELLTIIEGAKSVAADGFSITAGTNKESFRSYDRAAGIRWTISSSPIPAGHVEATVPPFRNIRINEKKQAA